MDRTIHLVDAGEGASPLLAGALAASSGSRDALAVAFGGSAGRALLVRGGLRIDAAAAAPAGMLRLGVRPLRRAVMGACGAGVPASVTCWSGLPYRAEALCACARRALPGRAVAPGDVHSLAAALGSVAPGADAPGTALAGLARDSSRRALGASEAALLVLGLADAPALIDAHRMLDVAGRAMLAGADVHLVLPACARGLARTLRYARGLGLAARVHVMEGAEAPGPWWSAADAVLVTADAPLVHAACTARGLAVVDASAEAGGRGGEARDRAACALIGLARDRRTGAQGGSRPDSAQSRMNASAASE